MQSDKSTSKTTSVSKAHSEQLTPQPTQPSVLVERPKTAGKSRLEVLLTVLPILTALLYVMGASYREGALDFYGLGTSLFPVSTDQVIYNGFLSTMSFSIVPVAYALLSLFGLISAVMIATVLTSVPLVRRYQSIVREWLLIRLAKLKPTHPPSPALIRVIDKSEIVYGYSVGAVALLLIVVVAVVTSSRTGRSLAEQHAAKWKDGKAATTHVTTDEFPSLEALQIACSSSHCAFWTGDKTIVLRVDQIKKLVVDPKPPRPPSESVGPNVSAP